MSHRIPEADVRIRAARRWLIWDLTSGPSTPTPPIEDGDGVIAVVGTNPSGWPPASVRAHVAAASAAVLVCVDHRAIYESLAATGDSSGITATCIDHAEGYVEGVAHALSGVVSAFTPAAVLAANWTVGDESTVCRCHACVDGFRAVSGNELPTELAADDVSAWWLAWTRERSTALWRSLDTALRASNRDHPAGWIGIFPQEGVASGAANLDLRALSALAPLRFVDMSEFAGPGRARRARAAIRQLVGIAGSPVVAMVPPFAYGKGAGTEPTELLELTTLVALIRLQGAQVAATPQRWTSSPDLVQFGASGGPTPRVAMVWSSRNRDWYGADWAPLLVDKPFEGMTAAMDRMNVSFRAVPLEELAKASREVDLVVLPNIAMLSDADAAHIREFVADGGSLLATGETGRFDEEGRPRTQNVLADVLGASFPQPADRLAPITANVMHGFQPLPPLGRLKGPATEQSYLTLHPERAWQTAGPHVEREPHDVGERHEVLAGFDETDMMAFGGLIPAIEVDDDRDVVATLVPGFRSSPIEKVIPDPERTGVPGVIVGSFLEGRVAYLPADLDRRYGVDPIPDHLTLLHNIVRWLGGDGVRVDSQGTVASEVHETPQGSVVHLVNLTGFDRRGGQRRSLAAATDVVVIAATSDEDGGEHRVERVDHHVVLPLS